MREKPERVCPRWSLRKWLSIGVCLCIVGAILNALDMNEGGALLTSVEKVYVALDAPTPGLSYRLPTLVELNKHIEREKKIATTYAKYPHGAVSSINPACYEVGGRCAPYFFVLGALKCGTTSVFQYLSQHPNVSVLQPTEAHAAVRVKEPGFFNKGPVDPTMKQYMDNFPRIKAQDFKVTGEASPGYIYSASAPGFLLSVYPRARMLMLMREPVTACFSRMEHWTTLKQAVSPDNLRNMFDGLVAELLPRVRHCVAHYGDIYSLNDCFRDRSVPLGPTYTPDFNLSPIILSSLKELHFIEHGLYLMQIAHWHAHLMPNPERLLIIKSEDFYTNTPHWMNVVTKHLDLPAIDWTDITAVKYNVKRADDLVKPMVNFAAQEPVLTVHPINPTTERLLQEFYAPFNEELSRYLGVPSLWPYPWQQTQTQKQQQQQQEEEEE